MPAAIGEYNCSRDQLKHAESPMHETFTRLLQGFMALGYNKIDSTREFSKNIVTIRFKSAGSSSAQKKP